MRRVLDPSESSLLSEKFNLYCLKIICMSPPLPPVFIGRCQLSSPCACPLPPWSLLWRMPPVAHLPHYRLQAEPGQRTLVFRLLICLSVTPAASLDCYLAVTCSWPYFLFLSLLLWFYKSVEVVLEFSSTRVNLSSGNTCFGEGNLYSLWGKWDFHFIRLQRSLV